MADNATIDPVNAVADLDSQNAGGGGNKKPSDTIAVGKFFNTGGGSRVVKKIYTDKSGVRLFGWMIHDGSKVGIFGEGLDIYNQIILWIKGSPYIHKVIAEDGGRTINFQVDNLKNLYSDRTQVEIQFVDTKNPANNRFLKEKFRYIQETEEERNQQTGAGGQAAGANKSGISSSPSPGIAQMAVEAMGDALKGVAGVIPASSSKVADKSAKKTAPAAGKGTTGSQASASQTDEDDLVDDSEGVVEEEVETEKQATPENLKQSTELVGKYIDKNPGLIPDMELRGEILSALASGSIAGLSQAAKAALTTTINSNISGGVSPVSRTLTGAMRMTSAELQQASVSGVTGTAGGGVAGTASSGGTTEVSGQADTTVQAEGPVSGGARASVNIRQSAEIVGEHLDKNPGLIADVKVRDEISGALAGGNVANLSGEAKEKLQVVLNNLSQGAAGAGPQVSSAAGQLSAVLSGGAQAQGRQGGAGTVSGQAQSPVQKPGPQQSGQGGATAGRQQTAQTGGAISGQAQAKVGGGGVSASVSPTGGPGQGQIQTSVPQGPARSEEAAAGQPAGEVEGQKIRPQTPAEAAQGKAEGEAEPGRDQITVPAEVAAELARLKDKEKGLPASLAEDGQKPVPAPVEGKSPTVSPSAKIAGGGRGGGIDGISASPDQAKQPSESAPETGKPLEMKQPEKEPEKDREQRPTGGEDAEKEQAPEEDESSEENQKDTSPPETTDFDHNLPEEQQNALAAARRGEALLTSQKEKIEAERLKLVVAQANKAMNAGIMIGVDTVWAFALPSFLTTVLLGAIIGDFLWAFKGWLVKKALTPLLKTESLRKKSEEIAKQVKIKATIKLNILAMNLIIIFAIFFMLFVIALIGCNYPVPGVSKLSVVSLAGYGEVCTKMEGISLTASDMGGGSFNIPGK